MEAKQAFESALKAEREYNIAVEREYGPRRYANARYIMRHKNTELNRLASAMHKANDDWGKFARNLLTFPL